MCWGVLAVTDFRSPILSGVGAALVERDFRPDFALKHLLKDANLIARFAQDLNSPIPALATIRETIKSAVNQGLGRGERVGNDQGNRIRRRRSGRSAIVSLNGF